MEDLDEWEVLPEVGFLEIHDDDEGKKFFSRKYATTTPSDSVFKNYFMCPSPKRSSSKFEQSTADKPDCRVAKQFIPVPIQLEPKDDQILKQDSTTDEKILNDLNSSSAPVGTAETDQDLFSQQQVFFKKETEFVDMKLDSPKSNHSNRGMKPPPQMIQFEATAASTAAGGGEAPETIKISSPKVAKVVDEDKKMMMMINNNTDQEDDADDQNPGGLNNILKWSLTGIGAICSFGVATVCIFVLGGLIKNPNNGSSNNKQQQQQQQQQKLQFHIYAEDKRLKQVVHHATKLNEAMSAVRGVPFSRAHITFGGYYDAH